MFISRLFAVAVAALASVSFVSAAPTAEKDVLVKRGTEDIVISTINSLINDLSVPVGQINTAVAHNNVSMGSVGGPCNHIITLLTNANANLVNLVPGSWDGLGPMPLGYTSLCSVLLSLLTLLIPCLNQLVVFITVIPQLALLLSQIDICLFTLLMIVWHLFPPVIPIVSGLGASVPGISQSLFFTQTLGSLGIGI